ncbi:MAG TPA: hypothetical protein VKA49_20645 [Flavitalea sp.]|nr:hypothetical protein [Flavitalea sp.]
MKKLLPLLILSVCISNLAKSQSAVYFEIGGPGLASFNFDTRFTGRNDGIGGRIGVGGFSIDDEGGIFVPIGLNYLIGKDTKHFFEVGAGFTYVDYTSDVSDDGIFTSSFGHISFGYRMQPKENGFSFRAAIVPVFNQHGFLPYYAGVSVGYKF